MSQGDQYEVGRALASAPKAARRISEAWCKRCNKLVAALVVRDGEVWLWRLGGRSGSHADMVEEFERSLAEAEAIRHESERELALGVATEFRRLLAEIREHRYPAVTPPDAFPLAGHPGLWKSEAACRGCRRDVTLEIDSNVPSVRCVS